MVKFSQVKSGTITSNGRKEDLCLAGYVKITSQSLQHPSSRNKNLILCWISWGGEEALRQNSLWRAVQRENIWNEEKEDGWLQDKLKMDAAASFCTGTFISTHIL